MHALTLARPAAYMLAEGEGKVQGLPKAHHNPKKAPLRRLLLLSALAMVVALVFAPATLAQQGGCADPAYAAQDPGVCGTTGVNLRQPILIPSEAS